MHDRNIFHSNGFSLLLVKTDQSQVGVWAIHAIYNTNGTQIRNIEADGDYLDEDMGC